MIADGGLTARPRILIVDDNATNRELLCTLLAQDADITEAPDGLSAIALAGASAFDLVLLDVMMPDLSGYEVCRRLRELQGNDLVPILLLTSLTEQVERIEGFDAGADDFITKPFNTFELRLRVRAFLRTRRLFLERQTLLEDLQRLHDLKDDLAALLVHDLRNPLTGLMMHLDLLESIVATEEGRESVEAARVGTRRLRELIDDLLQVRMLEDHAFEPERVPRALDGIVGEAILTMHGAAKERATTIVVESAGPRDVTCDQTLVRRAVENLLANAIRHSPEGSAIVVRIEGRSNAEELAVEDSGPGIPEEQRPLLFSKYGTIELRRGGRRSGHGLGLYLVSLVMQVHGGSVWVDSARPAGTRVVMSFPHSDPPGRKD